MVTRDTAWGDGTPCWVDLGVADIARAGAFYAELFGWEVRQGPPEAGGYALCLKDGRLVAGIGPKTGPAGEPSAWVTYLAASNADETAAKVKASGGRVLMAPMDVIDQGRMVIAADPGGAVFGLWQAGQHTGVQLANEPGSLTWNDNLSRDFDGNKAFYHAVFGYEYDDMSGDGYQYAAIKVAGNVVGGIGSAPEGRPPGWGTYFAVADTDAAVAKVTDLGGSVVQPPWDTPFGRTAIVTDNHNAIFSVITAPAS